MNHKIEKRKQSDVNFPVKEAQVVLFDKMVRHCQHFISYNAIKIKPIVTEYGLILYLINNISRRLLVACYLLSDMFNGHLHVFFYINTGMCESA